VTLRDLLARRACARDLSKGTKTAYGEAITSLEKFHGCILCEKSLTADLLNAWIDQLIADGYQRITARNYSMAILTLWRSAFPPESPPAGLAAVRRLRVQQPIPRAWRSDETLRLLDASDRLTRIHRATGITWSAFARAWLLVGYHSGLRGCDLLSVPLSLVSTDRPFVIRQSKTEWPIVIRLPPQAIEAVLATVPPRRELFLPFSANVLYYHTLRLLKLAGLPGSPKWLRKTGATAVELIQPGSAMAYLGHKTPGLAYRHYVDPTIVSSARVVLPEL